MLRIFHRKKKKPITVKIYQSVLSGLVTTALYYSSTEVMGVLLGKRTEEEITVEDFEPVTYGSSVHVSFTSKQLVKAIGEKVSRVVGVWHSHHSMGAFHSEEDNDNLLSIPVPLSIVVSFKVKDENGILIKNEYFLKIKEEYSITDVIIIPSSIKKAKFKSKEVTKWTYSFDSKVSR